MMLELMVFAQAEEPTVVGPPVIELLYQLAIPLWGAVAGYVLALATADERRRAWLARPGVMLGLIVVLGTALVGQGAWELIGEGVANLTDGRRDTLEALTSIGVAAATLPYVISLVHRYTEDEG